MQIRIRFARAGEAGCAKLAEAMLIRIERGMLARKDQAWFKSARSQSVGDGRKLDRFGPGTDDEPNICGTQSSPYLGGRNLPPLWIKCKPA